MARLRAFDEQKALDAAMQLFWEKGFEATSLSDLTAGMGIQRPSIYAAFGDKKALYEASLRKYNQQHASHIRAQLRKQASVIEAFRSYFEGVVAQAYAETSYKGCFCINTMIELAPHDAKLEVVTREHQMYLSALFQEAIERGMQSGELNSSMNAKSLANTLVVSLIGLTALLKSHPERALVEQSVSLILTLIRGQDQLE